MTLSKGSARLLAILAMFFGVFALESTGSRVAAASGNERTSLGAFVDGGCTHECRSCGDNKHDIVVAVTNHHSSSHLENCNTGSCSSHTCGETLRVQEAWTLALAAEGKELIQLMDKYRDIATYNEDRHSLQLRCDKGTLVASLPLSASQIETLAALD